MLILGNIAVRYVALGQRYGRDDEHINQLTPMVEFYDRRLGQDRIRGHYITRLPIRFMFLPETWHGLQLDARVPEWRLTADHMNKIRDILTVTGGANACLL